MLDIDRGIWTNQNTDYYRFGFEWPVTTIKRLENITHQVAERGEKPVILTIGPSVRLDYDGRCPEIEGILSRSAPETAIIALDVNQETSHTLAKTYQNSDHTIIPITGNGWSFAEHINASGFDLKSIRLSAIVAANNLSRVTEYWPYDTAVSYITKFFSQARDVLHPLGEACIISRFESFRVGVHEQGNNYTLYAPENSLTLAHGVKYRNARITPWKPWLDALSAVNMQPFNITPVLRDVTAYIH